LGSSPIKASLVAVVLALAILTCAAFSQSGNKAEAATGGIDVQRYCTTNYPPSIYLRSWASLSGGWNAWGWRCHFGWTNIDIRGVDMNLACRQQYRPWAYARTSNPSSPFSWFCVY
jgi:hypothetical protein